MFEVGWTEMLVIAVVMIVVVGPKDLPKMLRTFGRTTTKLRSMAGDFRKQFDEALKEAELDDVKKSVDQLRGLNPTAEIKKQLNPFQKAADEVRAGLDAAMKPSKAAEPASAVPHTAEPLKNGATEMPSMPGPAAMPEPPVFPKPETAASPAPATTPAASAAAKPAASKASGARKPSRTGSTKTPNITKLKPAPANPAGVAKPAAKQAKATPKPKAGTTKKTVGTAT